MRKDSRTILLEFNDFYEKLRWGLSTKSFLAFCDFEYSKFLNSFLTFYLKKTAYTNKTQFDSLKQMMTL